MTAASIEAYERNCGNEKNFVSGKVPTGNRFEIELPDGREVVFTHGPNIDDPLCITVDGIEVWMIGSGIQKPEFLDGGLFRFEIDHT